MNLAEDPRFGSRTSTHAKETEQWQIIWYPEGYTQAFPNIHHIGYGTPDSASGDCKWNVSLGKNNTACILLGEIFSARVGLWAHLSPNKLRRGGVSETGAGEGSRPQRGRTKATMIWPRNLKNAASDGCWRTLGSVGINSKTDKLVEAGL